MSRAFLLFPTLLVASVAACGGSGATKVSSGAGPMFGAAPVDEPAGARDQDATQQVNHVRRQAGRRHQSARNGR
jgi:hypothetical protein